MNDLLDRVTVARTVRELNERCSHKKIEYFAEAIDIVTLPDWLLTNLFQEGKITYEELVELTGSNVAERARKLKQNLPARGIVSHKKLSLSSKHLPNQTFDC